MPESTFTPRFTADGIYQNNYWYAYNPFNWAGYGLPNCTCYAWGRWYEILGKAPSLPTYDGGDWLEQAEKDGVYETGDTVALGAVAVYSSTIGGSGHVAVVEQVNDDGSFIISQSGYYRPVAEYPPDTPNYFYIDTCSATTKKASWMTYYEFLGFIYNPNELVPVDPIKPKTRTKSIFMNSKFAILRRRCM